MRPNLNPRTWSNKRPSQSALCIGRAGSHSTSYVHLERCPPIQLVFLLPIQIIKSADRSVVEVVDVSKVS